MARTVTLTAADLEAVLDAASTMRAVVPAEFGVREMLAALSRLVDCDQLFWTWIDVLSAVKIAEVGYPRAPRPVPVQEWTVHRDEHPICSGRNDPVTAISDVLAPVSSTGPGCTTSASGQLVSSMRSASISATPTVN